MTVVRVALAAAGVAGAWAPLAAQVAPVPVALASSAPTSPAILRAGTPISVALTDEITAGQAKVGDRFGITLLDDVIGPDGVVIPKGTAGYGEVTFSSGRGGFGRNGMLGIAVRHLQVGARRIALDGRYREEGKQREGAVAATAFAVGPIGAAFIKGGQCKVPRGRVLKARLGEDLVLPLLTTEAPMAVQVVEPAPPVAIIR